MNQNFNIFNCDLNPALWFICGFCRQYFPSIDALKEHKSAKHFEHWTKVRCIVFEEKLYDKLWVPTNENTIYSQQITHVNSHETQGVDSQYSCNCECHHKPSFAPVSPVTVSASDESLDPNIYVKPEEPNLSKKPNPFVFLTRLTSQELKDALQKNSSKLTSERLLRRVKRNRTNHNFPEISKCVPFKRSRTRRNVHTKTKTKTQINSRNTSKAQTICIDSDSDSNNSLASFLEPNDPLELEELDVNEETQSLKTENPLPLIEWLILQKEKQEETENIQEAQIVVVLDPDPTSFSKNSNLASGEDSSFELSCDNPVTCKLCQMKLETEDVLRNHVENCWLHNKRKHLHCVICGESFYSPSNLLFHNRIVHHERDPAESSQDVDSSEFYLPLVQWLIKEKEDPKNVVILKPDLTLSNSGIFEVTFPVTCMLCQEDLLSDSLLRNHVRTCWRFNKLKHVYCVPCKKMFRDREKLIQHRRQSRKHRKSLARYLKCEICEKEFATESQAKCHLESLKVFLNYNHKSVNLSTENNCDSGPGTGRNLELEELSDWLDLHRQIRFTPDGTEKVILIDREPVSSGSSHGQSAEKEPVIKDQEDYRWTCRLCLKKLDSARAVKLHASRCYQRNKTNHRYCVPCDLGFESPKELQKHKKKEHPSEYGTYFKCKLCRKEFVDEAAFKNHEKSHKEPRLKTFLCPHCPASFTRSNYLTLHQIQHGKVTRFACKFCKRSFNQKTALESHERTHTGDRPFKCQVENCDMAFISDNGLRTHTTLKHFKELGMQEFLCPTCGRTFGSQNILKRHTRICTDRPFKCTHEGCTKAYRRNYTLAEHERSHSGETPFICEACGKTFPQKTALSAHKRTHERNRFSCPQCNRTCATPSKLSVHIRNVHRTK